MKWLQPISKSRRSYLIKIATDFSCDADCCFQISPEHFSLQFISAFLSIRDLITPSKETVTPFSICHVTGHQTPVVSWRKSSGQLPQGRVRYHNSALQILHVRKEDSDVYFCSASNLLGRVEKKTLLIVASLPRFIVKSPAKVVVLLRGTLRMNCRASGDPKPVMRWKKQGGQLPVGRTQ